MVDIAIFGQPVSSLKVTVPEKESEQEKENRVSCCWPCVHFCALTYMSIRYKRMQGKTGIGVRIHNWVHTPVAVCLCQKPLESGMF